MSFAIASETTGMGSLLASFQEVFSWFIARIVTIVNTVVDNPILLLMTAVLMVGAAVGIFTRLLKSV